MTIQLFPDQRYSVDCLREAMGRHKSVLLQGETGSGKSVQASYMIKSALNKGRKSAFVVPRKDLLRQMHNTFKDFDIPHGFVAAGHSFNPFNRAHICTVGTLVNRLDRIDPDVIFLDESHYGDSQLDKIIAYYKRRGKWTIGLSATPEKPNGQGLDRWYDEMICGPTLRELIDLKRLSDYRLFAPSKPDLSGIKIVAGEYAKGQLADFMEHGKELMGDAVQHYRDHSHGKLNMTFCTSIKHSEMMVEMFKAAGIPSAHMDGETPDEERRRIARAFARRDLLNVCTVDLCLFGYDLASASGIKGAVVESISDCRPTKSRPLQRQKNGRALRYKDYPALIFDHAGNTQIHGMPCDVVDWTLAGRDKKEREASEANVSVMRCEACYWTAKPFLTCPNCGTVREINSREIQEKDGELKEVKGVTPAVSFKAEMGKARTLGDLIYLGKQRGMANPTAWAAKVIAARMMKRA